MQQAGIYKLDFFENKNVQISFDSNGKVQNISTDGAIVEITDTNSPELLQELNNAFNNDLLVDYRFKFDLFNFKSETNEIIEKLTESVYGWIPVFLMQDLDKLLINEPFFSSSDDLETDKSHTWPIVMSPRTDINNVNIKKFA